jgi:thermitase
MTGTSQATAFVTGAAVLVKAYHPEFSTADIKKYILTTGDASAALLSKTRTARRLNLYRALTMLDGGVTASGVVAVNTSTNQQRYTAEAADTQNENAVQMTAFGRNLMQAVSGPAGAKKIPSGRIGGEGQAN